MLTHDTGRKLTTIPPLLSLPPDRPRLHSHTRRRPRHVGNLWVGGRGGLTEVPPPPPTHPQIGSVKPGGGYLGYF